MAGEVANFDFPGIYTVESASYTHAHGTTPGVFSITCRPQPTPPAYRGIVTIYQGEVELRFPDCIVDQGELTVDGSGQIVGITIFDRRWKWRFPTISGQYNVRKENGDLDHLSERTPQQLAALLLDAMGEIQYQVGALPNEARPFVDWENAGAAAELENLCELLGCRVALREGSRVVLVRLGVGDMLPLLPDIMAGGAALDTPEVPDELAFVAEPDRFQCDLELEAVGHETDREVRLIDDLSYKPADGWDVVDIEGDLDEITDLKQRSLAKASVFKSYRIKIPVGGLKIPGCPVTIYYRWQLEFLDKLIVTKLEGSDTVPQDPCVYGIWYDGRDKIENNTADAMKPASSQLTTTYDKAAVYPFNFSFDPKDHVLHFGGLMVKQVGTGVDAVLKPAELRYRCCVNVRDRKTREYVQTRVVKPTGHANGTLPGLIRQPEYARTIYPEYGPSFETYALVDNQEEFKADAAYYIALAIAEMQVLNPQRIVYERILPIHLDGAIHQVTWTVSNSETPRTIACRNNDIDEYIPDYRERRRLQRQAEIAKAFKAINNILKRKVNANRVKVK